MGNTGHPRTVASVLVAMISPWHPRTVASVLVAMISPWHLGTVEVF